MINDLDVVQPIHFEFFVLSGRRLKTQKPDPAWRKKVLALFWDVVFFKLKSNFRM